MKAKTKRKIGWTLAALSSIGFIALWLHTYGFCEGLISLIGGLIGAALIALIIELITA